ncbi:hypothetical protein SAMN02745121_03175 [Nannocystis exedens]|uniref:Uncharacterized protein n=1 Tax=Nannocystis exedens TaxID=54 RepID=A0A1I1Y5A4_9BACT|nr:hypothetical protein NAEX_04902 [Nannocystis exedens]SFE14746.1 hypothetical protein SAMN02745121_03175 [Nannocystis exedens]
MHLSSVASRDEGVAQAVRLASIEAVRSRFDPPRGAPMPADHGVAREAAASAGSFFDERRWLARAPAASPRRLGRGPRPLFSFSFF